MGTFELYDAIYQKEYALALKLLEFARKLYDEGFDVFVECYEPSDIIYEVIRPTRDSMRCLHLSLEQRCKMNMAYTAQIMEEAETNKCWDDAEHLWEHGY